MVSDWQEKGAIKALNHGCLVCCVRREFLVIIAQAWAVFLFLSLGL